MMLNTDTLANSAGGSAALRLFGRVGLLCVDFEGLLEGCGLQGDGGRVSSPDRYCSSQCNGLRLSCSQCQELTPSTIFLLLELRYRLRRVGPRRHRKPECPQTRETFQV